MSTDKNKKALGLKITTAAICLAVFTLGSMLVGLFASQHVNLLAALLMGAIACLGICGAFFIKATWTHIAENRDKSHWSILDSPLLN